MTTKIKNENYAVIQGWMRNELELKGTELIVFAVIYGFSQAEDQKFTGSLAYLMEWTGATKMTVLKALQALTDRGLLVKEDIFVNNVKFCSYQARRGGIEIIPPVEKFDGGGIETIPGGGIEIIPNNKDIYNIDISNIHTENPPKNPEPDYEAIIDSYNHTCKSLPQVKKITDGRKRAIKGILKKYTAEELEKAFTAAEQSDFLSGRKGGWSASFDWLIKDNNLAKVLEGNYSNRRQASQATGGSIFAGLREGA